MWSAKRIRPRLRISVRSAALRSTSGRPRRSRPLSHSRSNATKTGITAAAAQEPVELRPAFLVEARQFAVEHGVIGAPMLADPIAQRSVRLVDVALAGDQAAAAIVDVSQGAEAIIFEPKYEVGVIECLSRAGQGHRLELRDTHTAIV